MIRKSKTYFLALLVITVAACSGGRGETPEATLNEARTAYLEKDAETFSELMTPESLSMIETEVSRIRENFNKIPDETVAQRAFKSLADRMGVPVSQLKNITAIDYIRYKMQSQNEGAGENTEIFPSEILENPEITDKKIQGDTAALYFGDTGKISFRKVNDMWKIHMLPSDNS